ncbi:MAG: amino acid adenylation domain-containing protein [Desulfobacterium sp.]|nr:amino acid adenylation domain-containing protein [Desulfobacterium sp.]
MTLYTSSQQRSIIERLTRSVKIISGLAAISKDDNFFRAGLSSIMLTRLKQIVENDFGVDVPMRLFYDRTDSVDTLARYVLEKGDKDPGPAGSVGPVQEQEIPLPRVSAGTGQREWHGPGIMAIFNQQLDLMDRQLDLLAVRPEPVSAPVSVPVPEESPGFASAPDSPPVPVSTPVPAAEATFPLSSAQKRIYFLSHLEEGEAAYHITAAAVIEGALDVESFKTAFRKLIYRHESLCTGFETRDDELVQHVHGDCALDVRELEMGTDDLDRVVREFVVPFDLSSPPLMRVGLGQLGENRYFLVMDAHHIAIDGTSYSILMPELITLYRGESLAPVPPPYSDYAVWEQEQIGSPAMAEQETYWLERFGNAPAILELPLDFPRGRYQKFTGKVLRHTVDPVRATQLKALARERGVTLFMLLLSAYTILLSKLTGEDDIILGTPIDSRSRGDFLKTVGMFTNTLVLGSNVRGDIPFDHYLDQVKKDCLKAFDNQDYPFDAFVEKLGLEPSLSRNPLFDVMFVYENEDERIIRTEDLVFKAHDIDLWTTNFDFILEIMESRDGLDIHLIYSTALFEPATMARWRDYYLAILDAVLKDAHVRLKDISILPDPERKQLLLQFNDTQADNPVDQTILHLFEQQVQKTPSATAVVFEDETLSFQALDRRAGQMASYLHERFHVGPGDVIGVRVRPSENLPVFLLAAVKLGAAFVPMEPDSPEERVRYILEDSGAKILLTQQSCGRVEGLTIPLVDMDQAMEPSITPSTTIQGINGAGPEDVFYIIYTSGTTGLPKGTLVTNRSLVNYLSWFRKAFDITKEDRFVLVSSFAFDMAHTSLWVTLLTGAPLHLVSEDHRRDADRMVDYITRWQITCLKVTPSYFYTLTLAANTHKAGALKGLRSMRLIILGGEDIRHDDIQAFFEINPNAVCVNEYGPTEATIACIAHPVTRENLGSVKNRQMIGTPIDNTLIYILDNHGQPTPTGVRGEICIGGQGLALGYLNRDDLTRAKFQPDPFNPGGRIYRTGDYGRWLADGTIEFFGRMDQQVKIRGYRVELGEIEQTLLKHPAIEEAVVIAENLQSFGRELIAYVVGEGGLTAGRLRGFLGESLPEYMLPAYFVNLPEIPLTPNGKLDRKALPNPLESAGTLATGSEREMPGTPHEKTLATVWESILGPKEISIQDNYFALGGDSIKAVMICARLLKAGLNARVRDIFEAPTIAKLAQRLTPAMAFHQAPVTGPALMIPIQHGFFKRNPNHNAPYTLGVILTARNPLDPKALEQTFKAIQDHHDGLRIRYRFSNGHVFQEIQDTALPASFSIVDLKGNADAEELYEQHLTGVPGAIDLTTGPLMRGVLYQTDRGDRLALIIHHLVADGVSLRILLEDLETGYALALRGEPIVLSPKTDSVAVFAHCLARYGEDREMIAAFTAWQKHLDLPPKDPFPSLPSAVGNHFGNAEKQVETFSLAETTHLTDCLDQDISMNDLLLTALARAAKKSLGLSSLYMDLEGHGRGIPESKAFKHPEADRTVDVSRTVGWFTTLHPLHLKVTEQGDLGKDIRCVRGILKDIPGQGLAHGVLLIKGLETMKQKPLPEIGFNFLGRFDDPAPDSIFIAMDEPDIETVDPRLNRWHELEIEGIIANGRLAITFIHNPHVFTTSSMRSLLTAYTSEIKAIINCCPGRKKGVRVPSGQDINGLPKAALDNLMTECRVESDNLQAVYPLSPLQEGMLFHSLLEKNGTAFFEQFSFDIKGRLDLEAFEQSWNHLFDAFDVFRTVFSHQGGDGPVQVVLKKRSIEFTVADLTGQTEKDKQARIKAFKLADRRQGFYLSRDVLMRVMVFECGPGCHHVVWSHHHIIMDGWSCGIMVETLLGAYAGIRAGSPPEIDAGVPYSHYIQWLARQDKNMAVNYWQDYLAGYVRPQAVPKTALPSLDNAGQHDNDYHLACLTEIIPEQDVGKLKTMTAKNGVTLNSVVQCAWAMLLAYHTVSDDVVFGAVVSGRPVDLPGVDEMVGLFLNTVPMRIRLDNDLDLPGMLKMIQARALESEAYHYVSLADIQETSTLGPALLNTVLIFENYPLSLEILELSKRVNTGFTVEHLEEFEQTNYDLALEVYPGDTLTLNLKYNARVYTEDQINRYRQGLSEIFAAMAAMADSFDQSLGRVRAVLMDEAGKEEQEAFLAGIQSIDEDF